MVPIFRIEEVEIRGQEGVGWASEEGEGLYLIKKPAWVLGAEMLWETRGKQEWKREPEQKEQIKELAWVLGAKMV